MTATGKLPVWATVFAAWRYLATQWRIVLPLAAFLLLTGPAFVFWQPVLEHIIAPLQATPYLWFFLMDVLSELPLLALAAVAIIPLHRAILTRTPQSDRRIPFQLGRREARYFLLVVALSLFYAGFNLAMLPTTGYAIAALVNLSWAVKSYGPISGIIVPATAFIIAIPIVAAITYVPFRLSLTLPAIATDHEKPLSHAWAVGRSNGWRLVAVLWIAILPVIIAVIVLQLPGDVELGGPILIDDASVLRPMEFGDSAYFTTIGIWAALMYTVSYLIEGAALSMSYRALGGMDETPKASP